MCAAFGVLICGRREAGRMARPKMAVGERRTDGTDRQGYSKAREGGVGPWKSPSDIGSRRQIGTSMLEQKVTKVTKGENWV